MNIQKHLNMYSIVYDMVSVEDFKYVISLWRNFKVPELIKRELRVDMDTDKVIAIAGVRRSGKTYVIFQTIAELTEKGIKRDNIVYVDFENERLIGVKAIDLDNLLVAHYQLYKPDGTIYLFLDEIQTVEGWDKWVRKLNDTKDYRIAITGSSSELLSREISSSLAGRSLTYVVYPFSFAEYVKAKNLDVGRLTRYSFEKGSLLRALDDFLEFGSFPEVALTQDESRKIELLSSYFDAIFFRDIIRRFGVRDVGSLNVFLKIISSNYAATFSSVKTLNYFKSNGMKVSRVTILNFLQYAQSVFLISILEQYQKSVKKRISKLSKTFIIDIGISRLVTDIDKGRSLENAVLLELLRRKTPMDTIGYLKLKSGKEVDFIFGNRSKDLIQVSYKVSDGSTRLRETTALVEAAKALNLRRGTVVTYDYEGEESIDGIAIRYVPFWSWSLPQVE